MFFEKLFSTGKEPERKRPPVQKRNTHEEIIKRFHLDIKPVNRFQEFRFEYRSYLDEEHVVINQEQYSFYAFLLQENTEIGPANRIIILYDKDNRKCITFRLISDSMRDFPLSLLARHMVLNLTTMYEVFTNLYEDDSNITPGFEIHAEDVITQILGADYADTKGILLTGWKEVASEKYNLPSYQLHDVRYSDTMSSNDVLNTNTPAYSFVVSQRGDVTLFHIF